MTMYLAIRLCIQGNIASARYKLLFYALWDIICWFTSISPQSFIPINFIDSRKPVHLVSIVATRTPA